MARKQKVNDKDLPNKEQDTPEEINEETIVEQSEESEGSEENSSEENMDIDGDNSPEEIVVKGKIETIKEENTTEMEEVKTNAEIRKVQVKALTNFEGTVGGVKYSFKQHDTKKVPADVAVIFQNADKVLILA